MLLSHYADSDDVLFGAAFSGRPEQIDGIETMIGPCVTNVPVRVKSSHSEPLRPWLARLQAQQLDLNQHQFLPLDAIQSASEIPWQHRLFDSLLVFQNYQIDGAVGQLGQNARLSPIHVPEATNYALTIAVSPDEELDLRLIYDASRIGRDTVEAIADDLPAMIAAMGASQTTTTIGDVLAFMPTERRGKAATAVLGKHSRPAAPPAAARSETEQKLVQIWSGLLGRSDIGIDDNFFDAGGQSILLVRMHRLIESSLGTRLQIVKLLEHPTIRKLAANLNAPEQDILQAGEVAERAAKQRAALAKRRVKATLS